jgi:opacity protein-like surface antigen
MKPIKLLGAALLAGAAILVQPANARGSWYAGLDAGLSEADAEISLFTTGNPGIDDADASSTGVRLRVGYQFWRYIAAEIGYADFGDFEYQLGTGSRVTTSLSGFVSNVVGTLPLGRRWTINGRVGWFRMRVKSMAFVSAQTDESRTRAGLQVGIGAGFRVDDHWELLLDYTKFEQLYFGPTLGNLDFGDTRLTSLGVNYRW